MNAEVLSKPELLQVQGEAVKVLEQNRGDRVDPLTAKSHTDHWLQELGLYVDADLTRGKVSSAKHMVEFWLDKICDDGRVPHMALNTEGFNVLSIRRRIIDRRVQKAVKAEDGGWVSPLQGAPVLSSAALKITESLPEDEATTWVNSILARLDIAKNHYYDPDSEGNQDGLLVQRNQYEMILTDGTVTEHIADGMKDGITSKLEGKTRDSRIRAFVSNRFFKARGDYDNSEGSRKFDPKDTLSAKSASKLYPRFWRGKSEFRVQDVAVQAMLVADNQAHERLYELSDFDLPGDLRNKFDRTNKEFTELWDEEAEMFVSRDPSTGELLTKYVGMEPVIALVGRAAMSAEQIEATIGHIEDLSFDEEILPVNTGGFNIQDPAALFKGSMQPGMSYFVYEALDETNAREARVKKVIGHSIVGSCVGDPRDRSINFSRSFNSVTGKSTGRNQAYWGPTVAAVLKIANDLANKSELRDQSHR